MKDSRSMLPLHSVGTHKILKRPGDTFLYEVPVDLILGPEGWLNNAYFQSLPVGSSFSVMNAVTSAQGTLNDAFAAGYYINANGKAQAMIQRWNGTTWTKMTVPNKTITVNGVPGQETHNYLTCISEFLSTEVWAAGYYVDANGKQQPLVMKYDGASWTIPANLPTATIGADHQIMGLTVGAANTVVLVGWAYGDGTTNSTNAGKRYMTVSRTADGGATAWTTMYNDTVNMPIPAGSAETVLNNISKANANTMFASGYFVATVNGSTQNMIMKTVDGGATWAQLTIGNVAPGGQMMNNRLNCSSARSTVDWWVVGTAPNATLNGQTDMVAYRSNDVGTTWTQVTGIPRLGSASNAAKSCALASTTDFVIVGTYIDANGKQKVASHKYNLVGAAWTTQTPADPGTGQESFNGVTTQVVAPDIQVVAVGTNGLQAIAQKNQYTTTVPGLTFTNQATDSTMLPAGAPALITLGLIDESVKPKSVKFKVSGGTTGWAGTYRIQLCLSYPRDNAQLVANGYVKYINVRVEVL